MLNQCRLKKLLCLLIFSGLTCPLFADEAIDEYTMKSVLLYNIIRFVEWPEISETPTWQVCFIGEDHFDEALKQLEGKKIQQRQIEVQRNISPQQIPACHLLFIAASELAQLSHLLTLSQAYPILTVADSAGFAERGVMVNLIKTAVNDVTQGQHIAIEINHLQAKQAGFTIHARLLNLAHIVGND